MNGRLVVALITGWLLGASYAGPAWAQTGATTPASQAAPVINLNTASLAQLQELPGVGPQLAARIKEFRDKNGAFTKVEDLMKVKGIGEKAFLRLRSRVSTGPTSAAAGAGGDR